MSAKRGDEGGKSAAAPTQTVGPDYRPDSQKPKATVSKEPTQQNVTVLNQTPQLIALLT
jgi:uracil phosphoribosyltransferase